MTGIPYALRAPSGDSAFDAAIPRVLQHEGHFSDHPSDPGGATQYGISLRFAREHGIDVDLDGDVDVDDIRALGIDEAAAIYKKYFWDRYDYGRFGPVIGGRILDLSVNMGPRQAHKLLQRALRAVTGRAVVDDGTIGPQTLAAFQVASEAELLGALKSEAAGFYRALAAGKPQLAVFLPGWLNRAYA